MSIYIYLAPAAAGKTTHVLHRARVTAQGLTATPRIVVPGHLQVRALRRRLAETGGALGVRVLTFDRLYAECLNAAGEVYTELCEPVQYRLIRAVVDETPLAHYASLADRPGFIQVLERLIRELKAARIAPEAFASAVADLGNEPRLSDLARIYATYQLRLQAQSWADRAGLGWLATEALEQRAPRVACDWPLLIVDGFDHLTEVQLALLRVLAGRVGELVITLTGAADEARPLAHQRLAQTRRRLEQALGISATPLPAISDLTPAPSPMRRGESPPLTRVGFSPEAPDVNVWAERVKPCGLKTRPPKGAWPSQPDGLPSGIPGDPENLPLTESPPSLAGAKRGAGGLGGSLAPNPPLTSPALVHLEAALFRDPAIQAEAGGAVELVAAPDRAAEVRAALRWLKARLIDDGLRPGEVALLTRNVAPYRPFIQQTAAELGLPVRLVDGLPLRANPAVAALLDLLRLMRPGPAAGPALPRRLVVEAWRSPYFDWSARLADNAESIGIAPGHADALDAVARWGQVLGGLAQWTEVLADLAALTPEPTDDEERGRPAGLPVGPAARDLGAQFDRFVQRLTPPPGQHSYRDFARWLEDLIGPDPATGSPQHPQRPEPTALQVVAQARTAPEPIAERDVAALQALKDVLRGLVWAEAALDAAALGPGEPIDYARFFDELAGAVDAASYQLPVRPDRDEVIVADVVQARGVPWRAVAVLGLAEGEFPATLAEDPFLRDADRQRLRDRGLPLDLSTASAEHEFFYQAVTRPRDRLLLTRPRLADNGADWSPSPFWEELRRLLDVTPQRLTSESVPPPAQAASWPELLESLAAHPGQDDVRRWAGQSDPARLAALDAAVGVLHLRHARGHGPHDGDLPDRPEFAASLGPNHVWSASRLEAYRACPFWFFVSHVLGLEPRAEPAEGLDARQLGTLYHRILEHVYQAVADPADLDQLLAALPAVAGRLLDEAPRREGFRETTWWAQTRAEIQDHVRRSLVALAELPGAFVPLQHEAAFGLQGQPPLVVRNGGRDSDDTLRLRGLIDRVDRDPAGRVRVIDYKTGGPASFTHRAIADGAKLQLPLYALAARDALGLGEPVEGFYWHVRQAEPSPFTLAGFAGGPAAALDVAVAKAWEAARGARAGHFVPHPPDSGCPAYCPAAAFCWHRQAGFGG